MSENERTLQSVSVDKGILHLTKAVSLKDFVCKTLRTGDIELR
jgi:hypothetical protein